MQQGLSKAEWERLNVGGLRFTTVASRFHEDVVDGLLAGAKACFASHGVSEKACPVLRVPGAFEIIQGLRHALREGNSDAVICLGAIVRGETPHFDYLSRAVLAELARMASKADIPVALGILTTDTLAQAKARSAPGDGNKGYEAALAAMVMTRYFRGPS